MKWLDGTFYRSRVGRRFLVLFVTCAVIPLGAISILSFTKVSNELHQQAEARLRQASKSVGMAVLDRLLAREALLDEVSADVAADRMLLNSNLEGALHESFVSVTLVESGEPATALVGSIQPLPEMSASRQERFEQGGAVLVTAHFSGEEKRIVILKRFTGPTREGFLIGEISVEGLFRFTSGDLLPRLADYCVLDYELRPFLCSDSSEDEANAEVLRKLASSSTGTFDGAHGEREFLAGHWTLFLAGTYASESWKVVIGQPHSVVFGPIASFRTVFPLAMLFCLFSVSLLVMIQIRRSLAPLDCLQQGARRIGRRDFSRPVAVSSGDEFEDLAGAFNSMADSLRDHFKELAMMIEVDRLILSGMDVDSIVDMTLACVRELYACDAVAVLLPSSENPERFAAYLSYHPDHRDELITASAPSASEFSQLALSRDGLVVSLEQDAPGYLQPILHAGFAECVVFPFGSVQRMDGLLIVAHEEAGAGEPEHLVYVRQVADQVGVALDRARTLEEKRVLAYYDSLTQLPNRVLFKERLGQELRRAGRSDQGVAVCLLDLDGFKRINDTLGHDAGDRFLQNVSNRIVSHVEPEKVARVGGDGFALYISDFDSLDIPSFVIQLILDSLSEPFRLLENEVFVTASVGIAVYPTDGSDVETLIKNADSALHYAKDLGRNNFQFFREELNAKALRYFEVANALRSAIEREEFLVYYQPVMEVESGALVGVEALLRWRRPDGVIEGPADIIGIAEETGLIVPIGEFVLRESCRQLKAWHDAGYDRLHVAVNLSPRQFREEGLVGVVRRALVNADLDARSLQLELTESLLMESTESAVETLNRFRQMGIRIALDDFGTGYSSLSYLTRFPLDFLKIDRSFIKDVARHASDAAIVRAIVAMAHSLGLEVIAEGVEEEAHRSFLLETGCRFAQGYHFSPPVPPEQIVKMLEATEV